MCLSSMGTLRVAVPSSMLEPLGVEDAVPADCEHPFRGAEGRLHQDLSHISRLVGFFIRDQGDGFLLDIAGGRSLTATHPAGELALVLPSKIIDHHRGNLVSAADGGFEGAGDRLEGRTQLAGLNIHFLLHPISTARFPFQPGSLDFHWPVSYRVAIDIGDDEINLDRRALLDKVAVAAQANIEAGRMNQQCGAAAPRLAVDIHDRSFSHHADRFDDHRSGQNPGSGNASPRHPSCR